MPGTDKASANGRSGLSSSHDDLSNLLVGFHKPVGLHDLFNGEGACDDRLQFPLGELIVDPLSRMR